MLYRRPRRRRFHFNFYASPMHRGKRAALMLFIIVALLFAAVMVTLMRLRPLMLKLAASEVNEVVTVAINDVISEEILSGELAYANMIKLEKDNNGNITALETNMPMINMLQAKLASGVVTRVENEIISDLRIPIGNAIGGELFSGRGPDFVVKILSVASVNTQFSYTFEDAGINQTRHKIMLEVTAVIDIFVPGSREVTSTATTLVEVAETVIVGQVPNVYAELESGSINAP